MFRLQEGPLSWGPLIMRFILLGSLLYSICRCLLWIKCYSFPCPFMLSSPSDLRLSERVFPVGHFLHLPATMLLCFFLVRGTQLLVSGVLRRLDCSIPSTVCVVLSGFLRGFLGSWGDLFLETGDMENSEGYKMGGRQARPPPPCPVTYAPWS